MRSLTSREIRLLWVGVFILGTAPIFMPMLHSQTRHLHQVRAHIATIEPRWLEFKRQNPDLELVELFAYTGGDGMFGAYGYVASDEDLSKVQAFMQSTVPPRPVYLGGVRVLDVEVIRDMRSQKSAEPASRANSHQPSRF